MIRKKQLTAAGLLALVLISAILFGDNLWSSSENPNESRVVFFVS